MFSILGSLLDTPAAIATLTVGGLASAVAGYGLHTSASVNLRNKRIDVISTCNARYDALAQAKTNIIKSIVDTGNEGRELPASIRYEIELYHRRYWGLKSDQIDYWLAGYVDPETLISWFMSTIDTVYRPVAVWGDHAETAKGGWPGVAAFHATTNERLFQIVEAILVDDVTSMKPDRQYAYLFHLFSAIENAEKPLINMLKRVWFWRLKMSDFKGKLRPEVAAHVVPHELEAARRKARTTQDLQRQTQPQGLTSTS